MVHEILAGFFWRKHRAEPPQRTAFEVVTLVRRPTPKPSPTPVPVQTPRITPAPHYTLAPKIVVKAPAPRAIAPPTRKVGGAAAHHAAVVPTPAPRAPDKTAPRSIADGTQVGQQAGGAGSGAGPGAGTGGQNGTGAGTGSVGTGNGGDVSTAPCGIVYLLPAHLSYRPDGTVVQQVLAKVVLNDGSISIGVFPWPFLYPAERANPFTHEDLVAARGGVPVQTPPPGTDIASLPPAVQVVLKHTNPATGVTTLPECPSQKSP